MFALLETYGILERMQALKLMCLFCVCLHLSGTLLRSRHDRECVRLLTCASITSQHLCISSGSSKRRDWLSKRQAFFAVRLVSR